MKTITYNTVKVMRTIVVTLVILIALCGVSNGANDGTRSTQENNELTIQFKTWMGNSTYWNDESDIKVQYLANQMKIWMSKTEFWSQETESAEQELALQIKSWINNSNFWSFEGANDDQELASRIKLWMNSKRYLADSDEQFITGNELAKN